MPNLIRNRDKTQKRRKLMRIDNPLFFSIHKNELVVRAKYYVLYLKGLNPTVSRKNTTPIFDIYIYIFVY